MDLVLEGLYLFKHGIPVYEGGAFHQAPLLLILFSLIPRQLYLFLFIISDYVIARCLVELAQYKLDHFNDTNLWPDANRVEGSEEEEEEEKDSKRMMIGNVDIVEDELSIPRAKKMPFKDPLEDESLLPKGGDPTKPVDIPIVPSDIGSIYLLNPLSILSCLVQNTQVFSTVSMALALVFASRGERRKSMLALSVGTYLTLYPFLLAGPCILFLHNYHVKKKAKESVCFLFRLDESIIFTFMPCHVVEDNHLEINFWTCLLH
jgi:hypothetical protein